MIPESEARRFRQGENTAKPCGVRASQMSHFARALHELAVSKGYESQSALRRALKGGGPSLVGNWVRGKQVPSPEYFGALLVLLKPNQEELESLVEPYGDLLRTGKGVVVRDTEIQLKRSAMQMRASETPFGKWIENFCKNRRITFKRVTEALGFSNNFFTNRDLLGISALAIILQCLPKRYNLGADEVEELCESIAKTIDGKISDGHQFSESGNFGPRLKRRAPKY